MLVGTFQQAGGVASETLPHVSGLDLRDDLVVELCSDRPVVLGLHKSTNVVAYARGVVQNTATVVLRWLVPLLSEALLHKMGNKGWAVQSSREIPGIDDLV